MEDHPQLLGGERTGAVQPPGGEGEEAVGEVAWFSAHKEQEFHFVVFTILFYNILTDE